MASLLLEEKQLRGELRWETNGRADFTSCKLPVIVPSNPQVNLALMITAHKRRLPRKSSFSLLLASKRLLSLDTNPVRWHNNKDGKPSISASHWSRYPGSKVEPDERDLPHQQWFFEFLRRGRVTYSGRYRPPPFEQEQMSLL